MSETATDPAAVDLAAFIRDCVERAGGAIDGGEPGRLDALLPAELQAVAGGRPLVRLALVQADGGEATLPAMLGSPFVDALIKLATAGGTVTSGHLPAGRLKRKGLREEAEQTLKFSNCRTRYRDDEAEVRLATIAQFEFKVAFLSEERRERLYVVPVNLVSGQAEPELAARMPGLRIAAEAEGGFPEAPIVTMEVAYAAARRAARRLILDEATRQQVRVGRRFAVEAARIGEYYDQAILGLERRLDREQARSAAPAAAPAAPSVTAGKVEASRLERERKLRELGETYRIRARAQLASVRLLWQPRVYFDVLLDRGSVTRSLTLAYDGLLERLELPACESCRRPTPRLRASSTARLQCPACSGDTDARSDNAGPRSARSPDVPLPQA